MSVNISGLTDDVICRLAERLMGTCGDIDHALDMMDIQIPEGFNHEDVITDLEVIGVERCPCCQWWMESCELVNENDDVVGCPSCRPAENDYGENGYE